MIKKIKKFILELFSNEELEMEISKRLYYGFHKGVIKSKIYDDENALLKVKDFFIELQENIMNTIVLINSNDELKEKQIQLRFIQSLLFVINNYLKRLQSSKHNEEEEKPSQFDPDKVVSEFISGFQTLKENAPKEKSTISENKTNKTRTKTN